MTCLFPTFGLDQAAGTSGSGGEGSGRWESMGMLGAVTPAAQAASAPLLNPGSTSGLTPQDGALSIRSKNWHNIYTHYIGNREGQAVFFTQTVSAN